LVEPTVREDGKMLKSALYSPTDVVRDEALSDYRSEADHG